ncbi:hypothetical protein J2X78_000484 [Pedobacter africanus]|uniref:Uncharacterized protein n=2 Tax=Pedobacter africanus TaxID=151894 RepID=A0ACC6KRT2_9SPHI|nr:hypothetical protein [Pedobacter africanus]
MLQPLYAQKNDKPAAKQLHRIPGLAQLLKADTLVNSIIVIDNFIGKISNYGDHMEGLSEPQKLFYLNQELEREVNNGGFNQYFLNSSGDYAHETILALKAINAQKTAAILQAAIDKFPGSKVPKDRKRRIALVEKLNPKYTLWEELDQKFFSYQEDLNVLNIKFIEKNMKEF